MPLLILADDLTGAADSAARCCAVGLSATVVLDAADLAADWPTTQVIALNSDSRQLTAAAASQAVRQLISALPMLPANTTWYKKIDSLLRGNVSAEIDALLPWVTPAGAQPCALVCPAFPAQGRGVAGGQLIAPASIALPVAPSLTAVLAQSSQCPVARLSLEWVRAGQAALQTEIAHLLTAGAQIIAADALTDDDLARLVSAMITVVPHALLCGSAGLMGALARQWVNPLVVQSPTIVSPASGPILTVMGSGSAMAHAQVAALARHGQVTVQQVDDDFALTAGDAQGNWLLHLPPPTAQTMLEGSTARAHADRLAAAALTAIHALQPTLLILTGGDTAVSVLTQLGLTRLEVVGELLPGIPLLVGYDANGQPRQVITKSGSFGDEQTLVHLYSR